MTKDAKGASWCMNDSRTCTEIGTGLTHGRSPAVPQKKFADHSRKGVWGYTYFVRCGDLIKIGHTAIPKLRFPALVRELGGRIEVLAVIPNELVTEGTAHARFAHLREERELFRIAPDLLEFIRDMKAASERTPRAEPPKIRPKKPKGGIHYQLDCQLRRADDATKRMQIALRMGMERAGATPDAIRRQDALMGRKPRIRVQAVTA